MGRTAARGLMFLCVKILSNNEHMRILGAFLSGLLMGLL